MKIIRTRFAPSPTGYLHVGGLRTALYAYLYARHHEGGKFYLRIEDTDRERYMRGGEAHLKKALRNFGLKWDGKVLVQSKRLKHYRAAALGLVQEGKAYYCFCSKERLEELRKRQIAENLPTGYDGFCRSISQEDARARSKKEPFVIRLKLPKQGIREFKDLLRGTIQFSYGNLEDAVLLKSDGFPTYHLAHIVDDHEMGITDVIRGEEWLSSTPLHLELWDAFGWTQPQYIHLPLIVNPDKTKLSKRQGDASAETLLEKGYLQEAILNFLFLLGWNPGTEQEIFTMNDMIQSFTLEKLNSSPSVFNLEKLDWMNGVYIRKKGREELTELCIPFLKKSGLLDKKVGKKYIEKVLVLEQTRIKKLSELPELLEYFFLGPKYSAELLLWKNQTKEGARQGLEFSKKILETTSGREFTKIVLEQRLIKAIQSENLKNGDVLWPLRAALSGKGKSPGPFEIADVLGKKITLERIEFALNKLASF